MSSNPMAFIGFRPKLKTERVPFLHFLPNFLLTNGPEYARLADC